MSESTIVKVVFLVLWLAVAVIRVPPSRRARKARIAERRETALTRLLLLAMLFGFSILPLAYVFTPWLDSANYARPAWIGWAGAILFGIGVWVMWRAHRDLGRSFSPQAELLEKHELVTTGIYATIRHPMYLSGWLMAIGQTLLLPNWIAGPAALVTFVPFYFMRVGNEERMMIDRFGEAYRAYMQRTGRLLPGL